MMIFFRRSWVMAVAIIIIAAVIAGVIIWRTQPSRPTVLTSAAIKASVLQTAKVTIPPVVKSSAIAATQLPSFMRILVPPQATGTVARAALYMGSLNGYEITYVNPGAIESVYAAFTGSMGKGGWYGTRGLRANTFAYSEFSGNGLVARAEFTSIAASSTSIVIWVVQ